MNKKNVITVGIITASLALAVAVPTANYVNNIKSNASKVNNDNICIDYDDTSNIELKAQKQTQVFYNALSTITSPNFDYESVKDKTVVLSYKSNNAKEGINKMTMNVVEYEDDQTTPKTVNFSSEIACVQNSQNPYTIYALDENQVEFVGNLYDSLSEKEYRSTVLAQGTFEADYLGDENMAPNPKEDIVTLSSESFDYKALKDKIYYTEVTYSINDGEEKTVYTLLNTTVDSENPLQKYKTASVDIYANVGDTIEYTVKVPAKDGSYYESYTATVVE